MARISFFRRAAGNDGVFGQRLSTQCAKYETKVNEAQNKLRQIRQRFI